MRVGVESVSVVVEAGCGSARVNSRSSRSRRTSGDSTSALQDAEGSAAMECSEAKKVLLLFAAACARAEAAAAGVEDTAAWAGRKELSDGVRFRSNAVELGPGVADVLSEVADSSCVPEVEAADGSCMEDRLSEVGMWT